MSEMQGGEGGGIISKDICILQSMKVVFLNQHNIDSWIVGVGVCGSCFACLFFFPFLNKVHLKDNCTI